MKTETINYKLPVWAICPIEHGDYSGLTDSEITRLEKFESSLHQIAIDLAIDSCLDLLSYHWDHGEEQYFSWHNDIDDFGGEVIDSKLVIILE